MTVQTICDRCGMEYTWAGVTVGDRVYCCSGCATGGPCTCGLAADSTLVTSPTVVAGSSTLVADDDVVIVE
jgi:hypothetical protein